MMGEDKRVCGRRMLNKAPGGNQGTGHATCVLIDCERAVFYRLVFTCSARWHSPSAVCVCGVCVCLFVLQVSFSFHLHAHHSPSAAQRATASSMHI
jgi:hypothetical protein